MAQAVLLHAEVAGIGELARDRRHVGGAEPGAERHRRRAAPPRATRASARMPMPCSSRRHLLRRTAAVVAHDLGQRLGEARPRSSGQGSPGQASGCHVGEDVGLGVPGRRRGAHPWPPARSRAARARRAADRRARRRPAPPGSATSATRSAVRVGAEREARERGRARGEGRLGAEDERLDPGRVERRVQEEVAQDCRVSVDFPRRAG